MLFVFPQTKIVVKDFCDWQDGTFTRVYYDQKATFYTEIMTVLLQSQIGCYQEQSYGNLQKPVISTNQMYFKLHLNWVSEEK